MKVTITIPLPATDCPEVEAALDACLSLAGGVTVTSGHGVWVAPDGVRHDEKVELYHFVFHGIFGYSDVEQSARAVAEAAITHADQQAVLVQYSSTRGFLNRMFTAEDFK